MISQSVAEPEFEGREEKGEVEEEMLGQLPAVTEQVSCWHGPLVARPVSWWSGGPDQEGELRGQKVK